MADYVFLGNRASNVDVSPTFDTYSKVIIHISDEQAIEVGNNTGRVLEIDNPFGTRQMAQDILNRLNGYQYQPYTADGALLNPASEIGDTISASTAYGMIFTRNRQFGRLMKADVSAPCDEEINHEYAFESPEERKFTRVTGEMRASIILTNEKITSEVSRLDAQQGQLSSRITQMADSIEADVSQKLDSSSGTISQSFAWRLTASGHSWYANGSSTPVMSITASGLTVRGNITATSGYIGNGSSGFTISSTNIHNGMTSRDDTTHNGIYLGTDGIALGKGNFKVTNAGVLTAKSGTIGGFAINASDLRYNNMPWGGTQTTGIYIGTSGIQLGQNFRVDNGGNVRLRGTLTFLNADGTSAGTLSAADLKQGAERANSGYASWNNTTSMVNSGSSGWNNASSWTSNNGSYCVSGVGDWNNAQTRNSNCSYFKASTIYASGTLFCPYSGTYIGDNLLSLRTANIGGTYIAYVGWGY